MKFFVCFIFGFLTYACVSAHRTDLSESEESLSEVSRQMAACNNDSKHHMWSCKCLKDNLMRRGCADLLGLDVFASFENPKTKTCRTWRHKCEQKKTDTACCKSLICHTELNC